MTRMTRVTMAFSQETTSNDPSTAEMQRSRTRRAAAANKTASVRPPAPENALFDMPVSSLESVSRSG